MSKTADELLDLAWGVIANAGWDGLDKTEGWQEAAVRWRDDYHAYLDDSPSMRMDLSDEDVRGAFHAADVFKALAYGWLAQEQVVPSQSPEVGWCSKHDDLARRFDDGSWSCWWECTVESGGDHRDSDFVPLLDAALVGLNRTAGEQSLGLRPNPQPEGDKDELPRL